MVSRSFWSIFLSIIFIIFGISIITYWAGGSVGYPQLISSNDLLSRFSWTGNEVIRSWYSTVSSISIRFLDVSNKLFSGDFTSLTFTDIQYFVLGLMAMVWITAIMPAVSTLISVTKTAIA